MLFNNLYTLTFHFVCLSSRANLSIESDLGSKDFKTAARTQLRKMFGSVVVRAIVITFVHIKTSMLPPLLVSSTMAILSVLENERCEKIVLKKKDD